MTVVKSFGDRLKEARIKARMSQVDLSNKSKIPKTMLSRYENNHILPSIQTLRKISKALGESVSALVGNGPSSLHSFAAVLGENGILITSAEDAERLAMVITDLVNEGDKRVRFLTVQQEQEEA